MAPFTIRPAGAGDLPGVAAIYEEIFAGEAAAGHSFTNWRRGVYPTLDTARGALDQGWLYVLEEGDGLSAAAILNHVQLPEYRDIPWAFPGEGEAVFVIHTLCVRPSRSGRGLAGAFVAFAEDLARRLGCAVLRLDTYEGNLPAASLYARLGYRYAGSAHFLFQGVIPEVLKCFEKDLTQGGA
jgi:GNAT superfamily N-acetyltransferase